MILVCVYIPPSLSTQLFKEFHAILDKNLIENPHHNLVIAGDINQYNVADLCAEKDLTNIVKQPTRRKHA